MQTEQKQPVLDLIQGLIDTQAATNTSIDNLHGRVLVLEGELTLSKALERAGCDRIEQLEKLVNRVQKRLADLKLARGTSAKQVDDA